ncbi:MAG: PocR ligand-binding domain-containing protein [Eubacteriales bacterium]|nr:PocR ligand-binding domain-containing protein [Eubacteriales bacterium]
MAEKQKIHIEDVIDVKELQALQDNWAKATNLAFVSVDRNGTPITEQSNFTPFCKKLRQMDAFREKCYYCDACGGRKARRIGRAYTYICHAGLIDFAIPIMIKGQYVGAILAGQVRSEDTENLRQIAPGSHGWQEEETLAELYNQVTVMPVDKILGVAQILCDSYNYSVEKQYINKVDAELREKDLKLIKEEKLRIEMEKSLREIELKALHYQINPHFLFNVLNTIGRLAFFENAKMTEDVVYAFADMMRYILRKSTQPLSSLGDEISYVVNYLKIQKIRLGSRLQYTIEVPEEYYRVKLPFLSLTTVVENSIKHAVENKASGGMIQVSARKEKEDLVVDIVDDGDGISPARISSILRGDAYRNEKAGAVGIYNVNKRLIHHFGHEYALDIQSRNKPTLGTKVTIRVPLENE